MQAFATKVRQFLTSEDGPTAVEYAVMLALIIVVCIAAVTALGTNANTKFSNVVSTRTQLTPLRGRVPLATRRPGRIARAHQARRRA